MEDFLQDVIKEWGAFKASATASNATNISVIRHNAQEAYDLLCSQTPLLRTPSYELRAACFKTIKQCIESKKSKLLSLGLSGLAKLLRDERFQVGSEPEDDSLWLPAQLLHATSSILQQCDDTQVHILRCILSMACASSWALNGRLVMLLVGRCGEAYENGTQPVRAAAQAAASQTLTAFCTFLDEECQEILHHQEKHRNSGSSAEMVYNKTSAVACFNEAIPVMQYICSKLEEMKTIPKSNDLIVFLLECLLTLVSTLPQSVHSNHHFSTFLWQRFCPALLALLGAPGDPNNQGLTTHQSKIIYSIGIQVVRLVGRERALRPVLEALFHRMLLLPNPSKRLEPLRAAKELLRSSGRLADLLLLSGPIYRHAGDDMAIIRLIMDSIEESAQYPDVNVLLASVECVGALLGSLEVLAKGEGLHADDAELANSRYPTLEQADYTGPLTYQSLARLPKPYRDVVANLKYQNDSDSSGIEGGANIDNASESEESSEPTEGPENDSECNRSDENDDNESIMDDEAFLTNHQLQRIHNIPKSLNLGRTGIEECNTDMERQNARHFVKTLTNILLPNLLTLRSSVQIDEVLQEFASNCCAHNSAQNYDVVNIINADGIYLATYSSLLLNLRLIRSGHYRNDSVPGGKVIMTEAQFVEEIHGCGMLVYISATWLCELYQNVLAKNLLELAGYDPQGAQPALIHLLTDVGGLCPSRLLSEWQKLQRVNNASEISSMEASAGLKLARRVLTCCWSSVVAVLGASLTGFPAGSTKDSTLSRLVARRSRQKHKERLREDIMTTSLEGLQKAASLSNTLQLQSRSSSILGLLASSSCEIKGAKIVASHALSLEVLIGKGLDLAAHSTPSWNHVFTACVAVANLEHALFSRTGSAQLLLVAQNAQNQVMCSTFNEKSNNEEETVDVYSFLQASYPSMNNSRKDTTIGEIIERSGVLNHNRKGLLTGVQAAKVCCVLSAKADELFYNAAYHLSLPTLCEFLAELCKASEKQLYTLSLNDEEPIRGNKRLRFPWRKSEKLYEKPAGILLARVGEVTLKCIKSGRPLIHIMRMWSIVGPHFMQAACHKERSVSKKAVNCIHDALQLILNEHLNELPHFHFNEALFKPYENLLCLELCDHDVQEQIVSSLSQFVEANKSEINSGWRPLFNTLRVAQLKTNEIHEIFCIFLENDNTFIFANAVYDFIHCLFAHLKTCNSTEGEADDNEIILKLIENVGNILKIMQRMPKCPKFNVAHHKILINAEVVQETHAYDGSTDDESSTANSADDITMDLNNIDKNNCFKIYYVLLEGLLMNITAENVGTNRKIQVLFKLLIDLPFNFTYFVLNHLIMPATQSWLKNLNNYDSFKYLMGLLVDFTVEFVKSYPNSNNFTLKQLIILLTSCISQMDEPCSKLGVSCIRHLLIGLSQHLRANQWEIFINGIGKSAQMCLHPLQQIINAFKENSDSFYGDLATVKVAARKDSAGMYERMHKISREIFLMNRQRRSNDKLDDNDNKCYVFLLYAMGKHDEEPTRIDFYRILMGVYVHNILMQIINALFLQNLKYVSNIFNNLHIHTGCFNGILSCLSAKNIYNLRKVIEASTSTMKMFDARPGLKFLVAKLANFNFSANMYTPTNTNDLILLIILVELSLEGLQKYKLSENDLQAILKKKEKLQYFYTDFDYFEQNLRDLRTKWEELCESYVNLFICNEDYNNLDFESSSDSCNSYLEKEFNSTDDETNEQAATHRVSNASFEKRLNDNDSNDNNNTEATTTTFTVPQEIQEQREVAISKDFEAFKSGKSETIEASVQLLNSLPCDQLHQLHSIFKDGAVMLLTTKDDKIRKQIEKLLMTC